VTVPPSAWDLPDPATAPEGEDLIAVGADLAPGTLVAAYAKGLFPMYVDPPQRDVGVPDPPSLLGWWSPDPRGVLPLDELRVTRSLRASCRRFEVTIDAAFEQTMRACAEPGRDSGWITEDFIAAYVRLHELGIAHSVETWQGGELVGGLYGVEVGGLFAGESMFHRARDASKVALVALVDTLGGPAAHEQGRLLDVQWRTPHLASLGVIELPRRAYLARLPRALALPSAIGRTQLGN
jgi:leucyl/phenylalanyl-tRNA--protein transferase